MTTTTFEQRYNEAVATLRQFRTAVQLNVFRLTDDQRTFDLGQIEWHLWIIEHGVTPQASLTNHVEPYIAGFIASHAPAQEDGAA